jgi:uncharacterized membrane protein
MKKLILLLILFLLVTQICILHAANEDVKVNLGFERTTVKEGEEVMVTLSAINPETNPPLNIQLILTVPDEMSITAIEFIKSGGRQYTATYLVKPGDERHINIFVKTHKPGVYYIKGDYYYYFNGSAKKHGTESKNINVMPSVPSPSPTVTPLLTPTPSGFEAVIAIVGLLAIAHFVGRKK